MKKALPLINQIEITSLIYRKIQHHYFKTNVLYDNHIVV